MGFVIQDSDSKEYLSQYSQHDGFFTEDIEKAKVLRRLEYTRKYVLHGKFKRLFGRTFRHSIANRTLVAVQVETKVVD